MPNSSGSSTHRSHLSVATSVRSRAPHFSQPSRAPCHRPIPIAMPTAAARAPRTPPPPSARGRPRCAGGRRRAHRPGASASANSTSTIADPRPQPTRRDRRVASHAEHDLVDAPPASRPIGEHAATRSETASSHAVNAAPARREVRKRVHACTTPSPRAAHATPRRGCRRPVARATAARARRRVIPALRGSNGAHRHRPAPRPRAAGIGRARRHTALDDRESPGSPRSRVACTQSRASIRERVSGDHATALRHAARARARRYASRPSTRRARRAPPTTEPSATTSSSVRLTELRHDDTALAIGEVPTGR